MKKIGVLLHSLTIEYALDVLNGVTKFFKDKDISLYIAHTKHPHNDIGMYEYQYWADAELLFSEPIDAYIVITGSYTSFITVEKLSTYLTKCGNRPVISIGMPLDLPNNYYTKVSCESAYNEIVEHLKNHHNCKKFAFFSANKTGSAEAYSRFESYKNALQNNNLEFDENLVFDGNFHKDFAYNFVKEKFTSKKQITFDALICANDLMAVGVQEAFLELGVKIPEELKIFGFDDTSHAAQARPIISTIDQDIVGQGYAGAELAYKVICGDNSTRFITSSVNPIYRQSCGCVPLNCFDDIYCNKDGELQYKSAAKIKSLNESANHFNILNGVDIIYTLFDLSTSAQTLRKAFFSMKYMMFNAQMTSLAVMFFEHPITNERKQEIQVPSKVRVSMYFDTETDTQLYEPGYTFDNQKQLYPEELFKNQKGNFLIQPIFSAEKTYGYIICKPKDMEFALYSVYIRILNNSLAQAYEYTESIFANEKLTEENLILQKDNTNLNNQSKTDELTKVLNRRGFMELGQKSIELSKEINNVGVVIFFDMDGLKKINDTYGHETGDKAIKSMAQIIKEALRTNDVIGRLGGDEFAAVAAGMTISQIRNLRRRISKLCNSEMKKNKYEFKLSCSIGATEFNNQNYNLKELLSISDSLLYKEKKLKHAIKKYK